MSREFDIIDRVFRPLAGAGSRELTDDAAVLTPGSGRQLVLTKDLMIEGIHYIADMGPSDVARRLVRVNLSDLAAMGARPLGIMLGIALPRPLDETWLSAFGGGLAVDCEEFGLSLLGGDTTSGADVPVLSLTAIGDVPEGGAVGRNGARPGDLIYVSGVIGDGWLGLQSLTGRGPRLAGADARYRLPEPRLAVGMALRALASAMLDVSDGLIGDAGHIASASGCRLVIDADAVPLSDEGKAVVASQPGRLADLLTGGDDYELLFCVPAEKASAVAALASDLSIGLTLIGRVEQGSGVVVSDASGGTLNFPRRGYEHD